MVICKLAVVEDLLVSLLVLSLELVFECSLLMVLEAFFCMFKEVSLVCGMSLEE